MTRCMEIFRNFPHNERRLDTIIIGGGKAGLAVGYYLSKQGRSFLIIDAGERIGAAWRERWASLRLFSPAWFDGLPGMLFQHRVAPSRPRMTWPITCKPMPHVSTFPCGRALVLTSLPEKLSATS